MQGRADDRADFSPAWPVLRSVYGKDEVIDLKRAVRVAL